MRRDSEPGVCQAFLSQDGETRQRNEKEKHET